MNAARTVTATFDAAALSSWYAHWACVGNTTCISVMVTDTGTAGPFADQNACNTWRNNHIWPSVLCDQSPLWSSP
jgi:hypothetical protein